MSYDARDQLRTVTGAAAFTYDDAGNRTDGSRSTPTNNRLATDGTFNYTYDAEGNRTQRVKIVGGETTVYGYDPRNRLTSVAVYTSSALTTQLSNITYQYDAMDRLVTRAVDTATPFDMADAPTEYFVYDGQAPVLKFTDPDGSGSTPATLTRRYLNGPAVDMILAEEDLGATGGTAGRVLWMLGDNQGTVRDVMNNAGVGANHISYDAWGVETESNSAVDHWAGYTGLMRDEVTGLLGADHRVYDPATATWIQQDPIFPISGTNPYEYVGSSPTNFVDPSGLCPPALVMDRTADMLERTDADLAFYQRHGLYPWELQHDSASMLRQMDADADRLAEAASLSAHQQHVAAMRGPQLWPSEGSDEYVLLVQKQNAAVRAHHQQGCPTLAKCSTIL